MVIDENGVPVSDVRVTLEDTAAHSYAAVSDATGRFTLHLLSPGDYRAEARKVGFFVLAGQALMLRAGANEISLILNHEQESHDQIQVTAPAHQIDAEDTSQRSALTAQEIREIPVPSSHTLQQSLVALPEMLLDHRASLHVAGSRTGEAQYLLDGFEIGDPGSGALTSRFNVDATRMAEVQTGRFGAAYAHSGASILSLETPDGDDRWRFGATDPVPGLNIEEGVHLGNWYPRFTFSGPIERGRFWFSDSISLQHTFDVVKQQPAGLNTSESWAGDNLLRLLYNISPKQALHVSFLYNRAHSTNLGLDALDPQSTTVNADQRRAFFSLKDQLWLQESLFEFGVAGDSGVLDNAPQGSQPYVLLINGTGGNYFQRSRQRGRRMQAVASMTTASRHWHGTHQLAAGFNIAGVVFDQAAERGEILALQEVNSIDGSACLSPSVGCLVRRSAFSGPAAPHVSNTQAGAYLQDTWRISRHLVVQAGLRTDWDRFTESAMAGPRASANVMPFGDDHAKLSFGWGLYNAPLNLALISQVFDQQQVDIFYDSAGDPVVPGPIVTQFKLPVNGLQQPRFAISSASWQQKVRARTLVGLDLLARNGSHGFAYADQTPTHSGGIFLLQDHRKDRYRAVTFSVRHGFSETSEVYGAFTRSSARSNEVLNPALGSVFYAPQQSGPVDWDAPNRLLMRGWTPTHIWGVQLSYFFEYRTGYPFSAVNLEQQLVGAANSMRFPSYSSLNVGLEKKFAFRGYLWAARVEAVNILGRQNPDTVVNNVDATNFKSFAGGQGRAFTLRVRFVGRK